MMFIEHDAQITLVSKGLVKARIIQTSACAGCNAKALCNSSEKREIVVDIETPDAMNYKQGDNIRIQGTTSMGLQAVLVAFVMPFVVLIVSCFVAYYLSGGNEPLAGIVSLASLVPAYIIIYLFRDKLKKRFSFVIVQ